MIRMYMSDRMPGGRRKKNSGRMPNDTSDGMKRMPDRMSSERKSVGGSFSKKVILSIKKHKKKIILTNIFLSGDEYFKEHRL